MTQAESVIRLYAGPAPGSEGWTQQEQENFNETWDTQIVFNVADPTLTVFKPDSEKANGTAIVICPGGGFHALSIESEGFAVARWLVDKGVTCFVLKYRLAACQTDDPATEMAGKRGGDGSFEESVQPVIPLAVADGQAALGYVREHAELYNVRPDRIGIIGFSAGGTVTAGTAFNYTPATRPDFVAPIYLAYSWVPRNGVPVDAPPMFILAATDDDVGLAPHSVELYNDWTAAGKSTELHLYAAGGHGFGMRTKNLPSDRWIELFANWLAAQGLLEAV